MIGTFITCVVLAIFIFAVVYGNLNGSSDKKPSQTEKREDIDKLFGGGAR
jgi:hypothetical protein